MFKNYWFYYYPSFSFIFQYGDGFDFGGLDFYRIFNFKLSIFSPQKTSIPALVIGVIIFGVGFEFCTHSKR